jgi:hypothetical protein
MVIVVVVVVSVVLLLLNKSIIIFLLEGLMGTLLGWHFFRSEANICNNNNEAKELKGICCCFVLILVMLC